MSVFICSFPASNTQSSLVLMLHEELFCWQIHPKPPVTRAREVREKCYLFIGYSLMQNAAGKYWKAYNHCALILFF